MATYTEQVETIKQFEGNVVLRIDGKYYAKKLPDSGLYIPPPRSEVVAALVLNPTQINPKSVTTTIASYSFKLLDKNGVISKVLKDRGEGIISSDVEIWLGRIGVGMDFADYYKMPTTTISKTSKVDAGYTISTKETTERMNIPLYDTATRLSGDISIGTTIISAKDDISKFPSAGSFQMNKELITYTAKDDTTKTFTGVSRGAFNTTPADASDNDQIFVAHLFENVNPIDILLQILISGGGGGPYDVLPFGLGITASLIDVAGIELIRDQNFDGDTFSLALYDEDSALKFLEKQLLAPCNLRFTYARETGKLTVVLLDKASFVDSQNLINHDTITAHPKMEVNASDVVNKIVIDWDFDEGKTKYRETTTFIDQDSIDTYGPSSAPLKFQFKGVQDQGFVDAFGTALLRRLATPAPTVEIKVQMDKSLLNVGDKTVVETTLLPNDTGDLHFANSLEVLSRSINWVNGDVTLKLGYTSFTGQRLCYIAPSDTMETINAQDEVELPAGRGSYWKAGWKVRLWDIAAKAYAADAVNEISSIAGDVVTFVDPWVTTLTDGDFKLKFPDYDDATDSQRLYCFVGINFKNFSSTEKVYSIVP